MFIGELCAVADEYAPHAQRKGDHTKEIVPAFHHGRCVKFMYETWLEIVDDAAGNTGEAEECGSKTWKLQRNCRILTSSWRY